VRVPGGLHGLVAGEAGAQIEPDSIGFGIEVRGGCDPGFAGRVAADREDAFRGLLQLPLLTWARWSSSATPVAV
jgi:hypothetical protein